MATISDQLAADIHTAFARYEVDTGNQQQFLFGSGNVTITNPDGTTGTIKSFPQHLLDFTALTTRVSTAENTLSTLNTNAAKKNAANTFVGNQSITGALSTTAAITAGNTLTVSAGNLTIANGQLTARNLELFHTTPFIDFHHGNSTADYTHRIITEDGALAISPGLRVRGGFGVYGTGTVYGASYSQGMIARLENDPPSIGTGNILASPRFTMRFNTRGSDNNVDGGQAGLWFEEQVGTNHRLVLMIGGFSQNVQYWQFLPGGNINNSEKGQVAWQGSSDYRLKHDIESFDGQYSLDLINQLGLVTFVYNDDDQQRVRRGVIAQQAETVDPQYVKLISTSYRDEKGDVITKERLVLDSNVFLMDAICAIQVLDQKYAILSKRVAELEAAAAL